MGNPAIYPEHLTLALLDQELPQQLVAGRRRAARPGRDDLARQARRPGRTQQPQVGAAFSRVLDQAFDEARKLEDEFISTEHLLLALDVVPRDELLATPARCAAASASRPGIPRARTRRSRSSAAT